VSRQRANQALQVLEVLEALEALEATGLLKVSYGAITILDVEGLRR